MRHVRLVAFPHLEAVERIVGDCPRVGIVYREIDDVSFGRRVVAEYYERRGGRSPASFTMEAVCAVTPP